MEVWLERAVPSLAYSPPPLRQERFLGGLFDSGPEVRPFLILPSDAQEGEDDPLLDEGLDPAKFFALSRGGGKRPRPRRKRRRKRPGMRAAASSYGKRKVLIHKYETRNNPPKTDVAP